MSSKPYNDRCFELQCVLERLILTCEGHSPERELRDIGRDNECVSVVICLHSISFLLYKNFVVGVHNVF